jgi:cell division inhibitor SepF
MGAMYRLKAYFGMVPAEEMAEYADEPPAERYTRRRAYAGGDRWGDGEFADREYGSERDVRVEERTPERYDEWERRAAPERPREVVSRLDREPVRGVAGPTGVVGSSAVRGALAMDTDALREPARLPERAVPPAGVPTLPEQRDKVGGAAALARITTLHPRSYKEARTIGERYRDGQPVIINLTELDAADAKRLVDFAAGLAFALRGSIDKVTNRVFLLTPADVEVSADDARKLAERGLFRQD